MTNIELRLGSFLEPVEGETFDLVSATPRTSSPPRPRRSSRTAGSHATRSRSLCSPGSVLLAEDGLATFVMASWVHGGDEPAARPLAWVEGRGCDALLLNSGIDDPLSAAALWNRDAAPNPDRYGSCSTVGSATTSPRASTRSPTARSCSGAARTAVRRGQRLCPSPAAPSPPQRTSSGSSPRAISWKRPTTPPSSRRRLVLAPSAVFEHRLRPVDGRLVPGGASVRLDEGRATRQDWTRRPPRWC